MFDLKPYFRKKTKLLVKKAKCIALYRALFYKVHEQICKSNRSHVLQESNIQGMWKKNNSRESISAERKTLVEFPFFTCTLLLNQNASKRKGKDMEFYC